MQPGKTGGRCALVPCPRRPRLLKPPHDSLEHIRGVSIPNGSVVRPPLHEGVPHYDKDPVPEFLFVEGHLGVIGDRRWLEGWQTGLGSGFGVEGLPAGGILDEELYSRWIVELLYISPYVFLVYEHV